MIDTKDKNEVILRVECAEGGSNYFYLVVSQNVR